MKNIERHLRFVAITLVVIFVTIWVVTYLHELVHNYDCEKLYGIPMTYIKPFGIGSYATCLNVSHDIDSRYAEMGKMWDTSFLGRYAIAAIVLVLAIPVYISAMRKFL